MWVYETWICLGYVWTSLILERCQNVITLQKCEHKRMDEGVSNKFGPRIFSTTEIDGKRYLQWVHCHHCPLASKSRLLDLVRVLSLRDGIQGSSRQILNCCYTVLLLYINKFLGYCSLFICTRSARTAHHEASTCQHCKRVNNRWQPFMSRFY